MAAPPPLRKTSQRTAYTVGRDIVGARRYQPGSDAGRSLIAHELTHVIQQDGATPRDPDSVRSPARRTLQRAPSGPTTDDAPTSYGRAISAENVRRLGPAHLHYQRTGRYTELTLFSPIEIRTNRWLTIAERYDLYLAAIATVVDIDDFGDPSSPIFNDHFVNARVRYRAFQTAGLAVAEGGALWTRPDVYRPGPGDGAIHRRPPSTGRRGGRNRRAGRNGRALRGRWIAGASAARDGCAVVAPSAGPNPGVGAGRPVHARDVSARVDGRPTTHARVDNRSTSGLVHTRRCRGRGGRDHPSLAESPGGRAIQHDQSRDRPPMDVTGGVRQGPPHAPRRETEGERTDRQGKRAAAPPETLQNQGTDESNRER